MSIGISILKHLGLTEEETETLKAQRPDPANSIYERDQSGLGYKREKENFIANADDIFARISASVKIPHNTGLTENPTTSRYFVPSRQRKRAVNSLSNEDLAIILNKPEGSENTNSAEPPKSENEPQEAQETHRKHHHHKHSEEAATEPSN